MNKVILMGRMTKKPELRATTNMQSKVVNFTIAVSRRYVKQGEERQADFINCIAWNKTAEFIEKYFDKGQQIAIVGRLETRNYTDDKNQKHYITEVVVEAVDFAGGKSNNEQAEQSNTKTEDAMYNDDLPF